MNPTRILSCLMLGAALVVSGCVSTVTETTPGAAPDYRDRIEARYSKSVPEVFAATKRAINAFGHITAEGQIHADHQIRLVEGLINLQSIYVRVEEIDPLTTLTLVQVRTKQGGTDLRTASDLTRRIAVELTRK